jgi:hypothetical protein
MHPDEQGPSRERPGSFAEGGAAPEEPGPPPPPEERGGAGRETDACPQNAKRAKQYRSGMGKPPGAADPSLVAIAAEMRIERILGFVGRGAMGAVFKYR